MDMRVMTIDDLEEILAWERSRLPTDGSIETQMLEWTASWRKESLEHYLPLGWSFCIRTGGEIRGYLLSQPFLFVGGMTQSLWVEHMSFQDQEIQKSLSEIAYRWSRDKHFQKVIFKEESWAQILEMRQSQLVGTEILTSKIRG